MPTPANALDTKPAATERGGLAHRIGLALKALWNIFFAPTTRSADSGADGAAERRVVSGSVRDEVGRPVQSALVRAVAVDVRQSAALGESLTGRGGEYRISYSPVKPNRPSHLQVEALTFDGRSLATSEIRFDAGAHEIVDIVAQAGGELTEYQRLSGAVRLAAGRDDQTPLGQEDVPFLLNRVQYLSPPPPFLDEITEPRLRLWVDGEALSAGTEVPGAVYYGVARAAGLQPPLAVAAFVGLGEDGLRSALQKAVEERITTEIPADSLRPLLEGVVLDAGGLVRRRFAGRLIDEATSQPVDRLQVRATHLNRQAPLGQTMTETDGSFVFSFLAKSGETDRFELQVANALGNTIQTMRVEAPDVSRVLDIPVTLAPDADASPDIIELGDAVGVRLPPGVPEFLRVKGVRTLTDLRAAGGFGGIVDLPVPADDPALRRLDAHANLSALPGYEPAEADAVIRAGFDSIARIARTDRPTFVREVEPMLKSHRAATLLKRAQAGEALLRNLSAGLRVDRFPADEESGDLVTVMRSALADDSAATCGCPQCESVTSPAAYLADLLDYCEAYVKDGASALTAEALEGLLFQPFTDLPVACEESQARVAQVRICIEVLRRFLVARGLPAAGSNAEARLAVDYVSYLDRAYDATLRRLGTSLPELRAAVLDGGSQALEVAQALRIPADARLEALLVDVGTPSASSSEQELEHLFGLADTQRDALSSCAKLGDTNNQITRWKFEGVVWGRNTDLAGHIHLSISEPSPGVHRVEAFTDEARTQRVASGDADAEGAVVLVPSDPEPNQAGSGLRGVLRLHFTAADSGVSVAVIPVLVALQLQALYARWALLDDPEQPLIDPDIITLAELNAPIEENPAFFVWKTRHEEITARFEELRHLGESLPDAQRLATLLADAGVDPAGGELTPQEQRFIESIERATGASTPLPVLGTEWDAVASILVQVEKRRRRAAWATEEASAGVKLTGDFFRAPEDFVARLRALPAFRADRRTYQRFVDTLSSRVEERAQLLSEHESLIGSVEADTSTLLRDALIAASDAPGVELTEKADALAEALLINTRMAPAVETTRVGHAVETLQAFLWSLRTGLLSDTHPNVDLLTSDFDEEWKWLGTYDAWRAALMVFLYPENVIDPALRNPQTPSFETRVSALRDKPRLTPTDACDEAQAHADYVNDIGALRIEATCQARAPLVKKSCPEQSNAGTELFTFLFGRSEITGTVYMSYYRPGVGTGYDLAPWQPIAELTGVTTIFGAAVYEMSATSRYVYVFAKKPGESREQLLYVRWNLEAQRLEPGGPFPLEIPIEAASSFDMVLQQTNDASRPPAMALSIPFSDGNRVVFQQLNRDGNTLDPDLPPFPFMFHSGNFTPLTLTAMVALNGPQPIPKYVLPQFFIIIGTNGSQIFYKLFLPAAPFSPDSTRGGPPVTLLANGEWKGTIHWPRGRNLVYTFFKQAGRLRYNLIHCPDNIPIELPDDPNQSLGEISALASVERFATDTSANLVEAANRVIAFQIGGAGKGPFLGRFANEPAADVGSVLGDLGVVGDVGGLTTAMAKRVSFRMNTGFGVGLGNDGLVIDPGGGFPPPVPPDPPTPDPPEHPEVFLTNRLRLAPRLREPVEIVQRITESELQIRRGKITAAFQDNGGGTRQNLVYLEEAFYFLPMLIALQLDRRGHHVDALDWYRTVYDYTQPIPQRKIYFGLAAEESLPLSYEHNVKWLIEPLNPHAIAATRRNTYTRYTIQTIAQSFMSFADSEFTRDTSESVSRAHLLYATAIDILGLDEMNPERTACEEILDSLDADAQEELPVGSPSLGDAWRDVVRNLADVRASSAELDAVAGDVRAQLVGEGALLDRLAGASRSARNALYRRPSSDTVGTVRRRAETRAARDHAILLSHPEVANALEEVATIAEADMDHVATSLTGHDKTTIRALALPWLSASVKTIELAPAPVSGTDDGVAHLELLTRVARGNPLPVFTANQKLGATFFVAPREGFCVLPNPRVDALRGQARLSVEKIRTGRNIGGFERPLEPIGSGPVRESGRAILPSALTAPPTAFRYRTLIERAKQLVGLAQQLEATFLSILEKRDAEFYNLLKARQDLNLSLAGVRLHVLGTVEARDNVRLSQLQSQRAHEQTEHYEELLGELGGTMEKLGLLSVAISGAVLLGTGIASKNPGSVIQGATALVGLLSGSAQDKRREELRRALATAQQDEEMSLQGVRIAQDRLLIKQQELNIASLQNAHAQETLEFLVNKFTNAELYDWMSLVIEGVYRSFLQQATSVARLAATQLAFERQETIPGFIQADYWETLLGLQSAGEESSSDRRGLTGSARLLQDIFQLDQYGFDTEQRKHQLTKTISLARAAPAEFQRFRETRVLHFATLQSMFDEDFPGHYLRLVKRVRISVIALIPPTEGIKATLTTGGISQVVTRNGSFAATLIRRQPESVSFTSPSNATGEFEIALQQDNELQRPFEGSGVATDWSFELPKRANKFDDESIADVLLTIDYTALFSPDLRNDVIERLGSEFSSQRAFTFRHELADQWFDLNNPDQTATPMTVRFNTRREDFQPNVTDLRIDNVALFFSMPAGESSEVEVTELSFTPTGEPSAVGGGALSSDGVISTRRGNASAWIPMIGHSPIGDWQLSLADSEELRARFRDERLRDILLVITYTATVPGG
jgi:hypothetical protein